MTTQDDHSAGLCELLDQIVETHNALSSEGMAGTVRFASNISRRSDGAALVAQITKVLHVLQEFRGIAWETLSPEEQAQLDPMPTDPPAILLDEVPPPPPKKPPKPADQTRRAPSKMYDFAMLDAPRYARQIGRPVGMKDLFQLGCALDADTKKGSHTAQLNRFKEKQLLFWREASDITLTQAGEARRKDLLRYVTDIQREQLVVAMQKTFGITPNF